MTSKIKFPTQYFKSETEFQNFKNKNKFYIIINDNNLQINITKNPKKNNLIKNWIINSTMLKFRYKNKKKIDIKKNTGIITLGIPRQPTYPFKNNNNIKIINRTIRYNNNYIQFNIDNKIHILILEYIIKNKSIKSITITTIPK